MKKMANPATPDIAQVLEELRAQVAALSTRLERLEAGGVPAPGPKPTPQPEPAPAPKPAAAAPAAPTPAEAPSDEVMLAISAAVAAFLGVRARIRQVRLVSSPAWAQQGRVSIQASHRLHN